MIRILLTTSVCALVSAQAVRADDPQLVGTIVGQYFYQPPNVGTNTGEELVIASEENAVGSYTLTAGEVNTVVSGNSGAASDRTPQLGVGTAQGAVGTLTVTGPGAVMRMLGDDYGSTMDIGKEGTGTVVVSNGGLLEVLTPFNTTPSSSASIQMSKINGDATLLVDDGTINISSPLDAFLFVGAFQFSDPVPGGTSVVSLSNGASLNITALAPIQTPAGDDISEAGIVLGQSPNSDSTVTIDASNVVITAEEGYAGLSIAREVGTSGAFTLRNGSIMTMDANTNGVDNVRYSGSFVQVGRDEGTNGLLRIETGAQLNMTSKVDGGFVGIGGNDGAFGQLIIESGGALTYTSLLDDGFMQVGQEDPTTAAGGVGFLTVTGTNSLLDFDGVVNAGNSSGAGSSTGIVTVANGGRISASELNIYDGGILKGSGGTIEANVSVFEGGLIAPGASPGTLDVLGDLFIDGGGNLEIEIAGTASGQFDVLNISGDLIADDIFALTFSFLDGFVPGEGATFDFLNVSDDIQGFFDFAQIDFFGVAGATALFSTDENGRVSVSFTDVAVVPVPMPALLLLSGLGAISLLRRGRRKASGRPPMQTGSRDTSPAMG